MDSNTFTPLPRVELSSSELLRVIARRRSIRSYSSKPLSLADVSLLLWSGYGCVDEYCERRTVPSAGATYPLDLYLAAYPGGVTGLSLGIYRYDGYKHGLWLVKEGDFRVKLYRACLDQAWVRDSSINIIITAVPERTTSWYGERGIRYIYMEAGHSGQNIYLVAALLGLGTVAVGAFYDEMIKELIGLPSNNMVLYVMPIGYPGK